MAETPKRTFTIPTTRDLEFPAWLAGEPITARFVRPHGEQPEPQAASTVAVCPFCERVPCEDHAHKLWRLSLNGVDG